MIKLKPCPKCGKMPKIKYQYAGVAGTVCIIQCKPFLKEQHFKVAVGQATKDRALKYAIEAWNRRCGDGK